MLKLGLVTTATCLIASSAVMGKPLTCNFYVNQTDPKPCNPPKIDVATGNTSCTYSFPNTNLTGLCFVVQGAVQCAILAGKAAAPGGVSAKTAFSTLAQMPGFLAGGEAAGEDGTVGVAGGYKEKTGAPLYTGQCDP
jgi:hypothetical protein